MTIPAEEHEYVLPLFKTQVRTIPMLIAALHVNAVPNQTKGLADLMSLLPRRLW